MKNLKTYKLFESKKSFSEVEADMIELEDILLEIKDLGYTRVNVGFTPTMKILIKNMKKSEISFNSYDLYIAVVLTRMNLDDDYLFNNLYGKSGKNKSIVDECLKRCINYLEMNGYKLDTPLKFEENPTVYQIFFHNEL